jgi:hypothetical protein
MPASTEGHYPPPWTQSSYVEETLFGRKKTRKRFPLFSGMIIKLYIRQSDDANIAILSQHELNQINMRSKSALASSNSNTIQKVSQFFVYCTIKLLLEVGIAREIERESKKLGQFF